MIPALFLLNALTAFGASEAVDAASPLAIELQIASIEITERLPLVATVCVRNLSEKAVATVFPQSDPEILAEHISLLLEDQNRVIHAITFRGGPHVERPSPVARFSIEPGDARCVERLFSLVIPTREPGVNAFLNPGLYRAGAKVWVGGGQELSSPLLDLAIREAPLRDATARDLIHFRHLGFLEGRESGRQSGNSELESVIARFPNSEYAHWIRFWKFYHHGPMDEALHYARRNPEFPLSDNLMFHMAEGLFNKGDYTRSREVLAELTRLFPDGDTKPRADDLRDKLTHKP